MHTSSLRTLMLRCVNSYNSEEDEPDAMRSTSSNWQVRCGSSSRRVCRAAVQVHPHKKRSSY